MTKSLVFRPDYLQAREYGYLKVKLIVMSAPTILSFNGLKSALEKALGIMALHLPAPNSYVPEINLELLRDYATKKGKDSLVGKQCSSMRDMGDVSVSCQWQAQRNSHTYSVPPRGLFSRLARSFSRF